MFVVSTFFASAADACTILNKRSVRMGVEKGIQGQCANNGQSIACTLGDEGEGINCSGPEGNFSGDNMVELVSSACGCGDPRQSPGTLEQQLESYP
jgi:hypothetical protein